MPIGPHGEKRPQSVVQNAILGCRILVGDAEETYMKRRPLAQSYLVLGGKWTAERVPNSPVVVMRPVQKPLIRRH